MLFHFKGKIVSVSTKQVYFLFFMTICNDCSCKLNYIRFIIYMLLYDRYLTVVSETVSHFHDKDVRVSVTINCC